jgi:polar amino acid transport system substrate-binding protein
MCLLSGCKDDDKERDKTLIFGTCADYPPFEFVQDGEMTGFDVDLAKLVAEKLGKRAEFKDIALSSILISVKDGAIDAAIAALGATQERKQNYDFSDPYYKESLAILYRNDAPIKDVTQIETKKIACQLGTLQEKWLKDNTKAEAVSIDSMLQAVEILKSGHVVGVIMDTVNAKEFISRNTGLGYSVVVKDFEESDGFSLAFAKGSSLVGEVNSVLAQLKENGELNKLKKKWKLDD